MTFQFSALKNVEKKKAFEVYNSNIETLLHRVNIVGALYNTIIINDY